MMLGVVAGPLAASCRRAAGERYPGADWTLSPGAEEPGGVGGRFAAVRRFLEARCGSEAWRAAVAQDGQIVWEAASGMAAGQALPAHSIVKSVIASAVGATREAGLLPPLGEPVFRHFPELAEAVTSCPDHAAAAELTDHDHSVTLEMLLDHSGGFLNAKRKPGDGLTYGTVPSIVLAHLLARVHGRFCPQDEYFAGGTGELLLDLIGRPIGAEWLWYYRPVWRRGMRLDHLIWNFPEMKATARQLLRLGWLWLNEGRWEGRRVIPPDWHRRCVRVSKNIKAAAPERDWIFGYSFWSNSEGRLWPSLPGELYMSAGAFGRRVFVFPRQRAVAVFHPGPREQGKFVESLRDEEPPRLLLEAVS